MKASVHCFLCRCELAEEESEKAWDGTIDEFVCPKCSGKIAQLPRDYSNSIQTKHDRTERQGPD